MTTLRSEACPRALLVVLTPSAAVARWAACPIFKIVTLYAPLRVFAPLAFLSFFTGVFYGIWNVVKFDKIHMGSALLIQLGVVVFLFGLISEQIASMQDRR